MKPKRVNIYKGLDHSRVVQPTLLPGDERDGWPSSHGQIRAWHDAKRGGGSARVKWRLVFFLDFSVGPNWLEKGLHLG